MSTVLASFLGSLTDTQKALTALMGACAFGFAVATAVQAQRQVPHQIASLVESDSVMTIAIEANTVAIQNMSGEAARAAESAASQMGELVICLLTLPENTSPIQARLECG